MLVMSLRIVMRMSHFIVENLEYLYVIYTFGKLEKKYGYDEKNTCFDCPCLYGAVSVEGNC